MPSTLSKTTNIDTAYTYDASSALATKTVSSTTNAKTSTSITNYATQEVSVTSPEGRVQTLQLDPLMRHITQSAYADLAPTSYTYNNAGQLLQSTQGTRTNSNTYDASGNLVTNTDASGNITSYAYDARNRLVSITNAQNQVTSFTYDANSNETRLTTPTPANFDSAFNSIDLKVSMTSPLGYTTNYTYDAEKRLTQMTRPSGKIITNSYLNGQHVSTQTPENSYSYTYDCGSKISKIQRDTAEAVNYSYDGDLLTSMSYTGELNQIINYSYNSDFLADSITYAGSTETLDYDNDGMLIQSGDFAITRDTINALPTKVSDTVFTQKRTFNTYGEIDKEVNRVNSQMIYKSRIPERNANGQIRKRVERLGDTKKVYLYTYDNMNRLIKARVVDKQKQADGSFLKTGKRVEKYEYDQNGNRVKAIYIQDGVRTAITTSYTIEDQIERVGAFTYTYDVDGYLTSKADGNGTTSYVYGSLGELKQVTLPNADVITYRHNANNQRVAKLKNGTVVEKYLWKDLTTLLAVYNGANNLKQRYTYSDNRVPNKVDYEGVSYYLTYDQVGSLRAVTDISGNIIKELSYDSFGNILSDSNPSMSLPFAFAGGLYDNDTGLIRFGYRDYDTITGKWTAKDPIGFDGGDTSLYGYVLSDPVNFIDPTGEIPLLAIPFVIGGLTSYLNAPNNEDEPLSGATPEAKATMCVLGLGATGSAAKGYYNLNKHNAHTGHGPHLHWGPKRNSHPNSPRKWHVGPMNPNHGGPRGQSHWQGWKDWFKKGRPWTWK
jgi:RHS repeat-associated protein